MSQPRNKNIPDHVSAVSSGFITWNDEDPKSIEAAQAALGKAYSTVQPIMRSTSSADFSVRTGMDRTDYEVFRPGESIPRGRSEILAACVGAYERVSPIKNIIDMMVDFTTEGIRLVHPNSQVQKFHQNWAKKVNFNDRSQHFSNNFYLMGVAIAKRTLAKLSARVVDDIQTGVASASADSEIYDIQPLPKPKVVKNVIPYGYDFLNPQTITLIGGDLALFTGKLNYGIQIPYHLADRIRNPRTDEDKILVSTIPAYILNPIKAGSNTVVLDESRMAVYHYKKNDWDQWANPILYSIMDDIVLLQKMKLTDLAALDGAISHIRIWKLGSLEHKILPTEAAFQKLNDVLIHAGNGQSFDLIWGPDLTLDETTSDIHKYLGQEKYVPVLSSIYSGLGVPPTLVGGGGGDKGFTNNSLSMKTLIQRLNYGREALVRFWENEALMIQQAMGFRFPAKIEFKHSVLVDEAAFHTLLIDLLDRDVISVERVRDHLGYIPEIEDSLVKYEWRTRNSKKSPPKAGPFHDAEQDHSLKKIFAQTGVVTPSQVGLELTDPTPSEIKTMKILNPVKAPTTSPAKKGQQGEGRPPGSKDTTPRKTRRIGPRASVEGDSEFLELMLWAKDTQSDLADIMHPFYLKACNKRNMRQLTTAEVEEIEHLKFAVLCNLEPYTKITTDVISKLIAEPLPIHIEAEGFWRVLVATFLEKRSAQPTLEDVRQIQNYVYALYKI